MEPVTKQRKLGIVERLAGRAADDTESDARTVGAALLSALAVGMIFAASWNPPFWAAALLWASASTAVGLLLGFLFGIPRFLARSGTTAPASVAAGNKTGVGQAGSTSGGQTGDGQVDASGAAGKTAGGDADSGSAAAGEAGIGQAGASSDTGTETGSNQSGGSGANERPGKLPPGGGSAAGGQANAAPPTPVGVNTNLEEISDWLTKIIVGVSLVELKTLKGELLGAAQLMAQSLGGARQLSFAYALMLYFSISGFLGSYLLTRLYLQRAFRNASQ